MTETGRKLRREWTRRYWLGWCVEWLRRPGCKRLSPGIAGSSPRSSMNQSSARALSTTCPRSRGTHLSDGQGELDVGLETRFRGVDLANLFSSDFRFVRVKFQVSSATVIGGEHPFECIPHVFAHRAFPCRRSRTYPHDLASGERRVMHAESVQLRLLFENHNLFRRPGFQKARSGVRP